MKMNKKSIRAIICAVIVAIVGYETQITIMKVLGLETHRPDIIRNFRIGRRVNNGRRWDGLAWDDDELDVELEC